MSVSFMLTSMNGMELQPGTSELKVHSLSGRGPEHICLPVLPVVVFSRVIARLH